MLIIFTDNVSPRERERVDNLLHKLNSADYRGAEMSSNSGTRPGGKAKYEMLL